MRHALIRFLAALDVDTARYAFHLFSPGGVAKPNSQVRFEPKQGLLQDGERTTTASILRGVADPGLGSAAGVKAAFDILEDGFRGPPRASPDRWWCRYRFRWLVHPGCTNGFT